MQLNLQPLKPDLHGVYTIKYNDESWSLSILSLQGCHLRICKSINENSNHEILLPKYFQEKFLQVRICPDSPCIIEPINKKGKSTHFAAIVNLVGCLYDKSLVTIRVSFKTKEEGTLWHLAFEKAKSFVSRQATSGDMQSLIDLSTRMRSAISVRERFYYMHVYSRCFIGSEAVNWIRSDQKCTEEEAIELGNRMMNVNLFYHVRHDRFFLNSQQYYRFNKHSLRDIVEGLRAPIGIIQDISFPNTIKMRSNPSLTNDFERDSSNKERSSSKSEENVESLSESSRSMKMSDSMVLLSQESMEMELLRLKSSLEVANNLKIIHNNLITESNNLKELHMEQLLTIRLLRAVVIGVISMFIFHIILREIYHCSITIMSTFYLSSAMVLLLLLHHLSSMQPKTQFRLQERLVDSIPPVAKSSISASILPSAPSLQTSIPPLELDHENIFSIPPPSTWPNLPLLIRRSPTMYLHDDTSTSIHQLSIEERQRVYRLTRPIQIHTADPEVSVIDIDSNIFCGKLYTIFAGLKDSPLLFRSKKRLFEVIVQGKFKENVLFSEVYTGQIFSQPFSNLPPSWLIRMCLVVLAQLQPALQVSLEGSNPYLISPLASTAKKICECEILLLLFDELVVVSEDGKEPLLSELIGDCPEDMSLVDSSIFSGMKSHQRGQFFSHRSNLLKYSYSPKHVYTFDFYQHVFNLANMTINAGVTTIDVLQIIGNAPIQIMSIHWDPVLHPKYLEESNQEGGKKLDYLYNIEIWHERAVSKRGEGEQKD